MTEAGTHSPPVRYLASAGVGIGALWFALTVDERITDPLALVLVGYVVVANLLAVRFRGTLWVSASFTFSMLAVVELGPAAAFAIVAAGELATWAIERYRPTAAAINLCGAGLPNLAAGTLFEAIGPANRGGLTLVAVLALVATFALALNFVLVRTLTSLEGDGRLHLTFGVPRELRIPFAINLGLTVVFATLALRSPLALVCAGVLLAAVALREMLTLTAATLREKAQRTDMSIGLVDGLIGTLAERDPGAAHHAAAVARYARDIARARGMDEQVCEAAHSAGLLHDIGTIALPDFVASGRRDLEYSDWAVIRRHPELGATMISGLGEVAEAVRCHHERPDGRGYPRGLTAEEIPPLASIVAVAEVYDTLTRDDGAAKSSFEALYELRRVAGEQLCPDSVEALADTLAGRAVADRHASGITIEHELAAHRETAATESDETAGTSRVRLRPSLAPPRGAA